MFIRTWNQPHQDAFQFFFCMRAKCQRTIEFKFHENPHGSFNLPLTFLHESFNGKWKYAWPPRTCDIPTSAAAHIFHLRRKRQNFVKAEVWHDSEPYERKHHRFEIQAPVCTRSHKRLLYKFNKLYSNTTAKFHLLDKTCRTCSTST